MYEYIGPSQMQFPRRELELADAFLDAIPERYRNMPRVKQIKKEALRWSVETMNDSDPSESIRAAEIVPLTASRFEVRHFRYVGGTRPLLIFSEIAGNFHESDAEIMPLVKALIVLDDFLIDNKVLPSYQRLYGLREAGKSIADACAEYSAASRFCIPNIQIGNTNC